MLSLLPFPLNLIAGAVLAAIQKWIVPKFPTADQTLANEFINFLQTGVWTTALAAASVTHKNTLSAIAVPPELKN